MATIDAVIEEVKHYKPLFRPNTLPQYTIDALGQALKKGCFLLNLDNNSYAISKWTGPKRTRTYPYQRVYDTIKHRPRVALIPYFKDEGKDGDADYLQWDTVSLMSLLNVYVIFTYHVRAVRNPRSGKDKITEQEIDTDYVRERLEELAVYQSDPVHWNMAELNHKLIPVIDKTIAAYSEIERQTGVPLHAQDGLIKRRQDIENFQTNSRALALLAQSREVNTEHLNERAGQGLKGRIHIKNFYNGQYNLTVDEVYLIDETLFLTEKKHSKKVLPSDSDVKDGLLKLILYGNLAHTTIAGKPYRHVAVLGLTSTAVTGYIHSLMTGDEQETFFKDNPSLKVSHRRDILNLFAEANENNFVAFVVNADDEDGYRETLFTEISERKFSNS